MFVKFLCRTFNLLSRIKLANILVRTYGQIRLQEDVLKKKYDNKNLTEWTYYKKLWKLKGRLAMLDDLIKLLR